MTDADASSDIVILDTVDSTLDAAKLRLEAGSDAPFVIAAREQTKGRGRAGRVWKSTPGNLAVTFHQPFEGSHQEAARLSFTVSLAVRDVLKNLAPEAEVRIKWPNDVLLNQRKVCGILLENLGGTQNNSLRLLIGIGVNLANHPDAAGSNWPATSIAAETGKTPAFETALSLLVEAVNRRILIEQASGFSSTRREWLASAARLGQSITVRLPGRELHGLFQDIDETGALVLETAAGIRKITAGDVFFPEVAICS